MLTRIGFIAACLLLPVIWGILVNQAFDLWQRRPPRDGNSGQPDQDEDSIFPDYQI